MDCIFLIELEFFIVYFFFMQLKKNHIIKPYELHGHVWLVDMVCGSGEFNFFFFQFHL